MNRILLVTTKGCAACLIMNRLLNQAIEESHKSIALEVKDIKKVDTMFLRDNKVTDFPTTFFIKDGVVKFRYTGTNPVTVIHRWIDIHFK